MDAKIWGEGYLATTNSHTDTPKHRRNSCRVRSALWLAAATLLAASGSARAISFTITDLSPGISSFAYGINDSGQVVGYVNYISGVRATIWNGTTATELGTLGGTRSSALGINDAGQVVGVSTTASGAFRATAWSGTTAFDLGTLPGGISSQANAINNAGQVFGSSGSFGGIYATVWNGTTITNLSPGIDSQVLGVNNAGQAVGVAYNYNGRGSQATVWNGTAATYLGTLGGTDSSANAVNEVGQVVGNYRSSSGTTRAALWSGTTATDLGTLGGSFSAAADINSTGQIVGSATTAGDADQVATIWDGGTAMDLNTLLFANAAGWKLQSANGINDKGQIIAFGYNELSGGSTVLLTPIEPTVVPLPAALPLLLSGLAALGVASRRRGRGRLGDSAS